MSQAEGRVPLERITTLVDRQTKEAFAAAADEQGLTMAALVRLFVVGTARKRLDAGAEALTRAFPGAVELEQ